MERRKAFKYLAISAAGLASVPFWMDSWTPEKLPAVSEDFNKDQAIILTSMVGAIIPATDTPGAKELEVDKFVLTMVSDCFEKEKQQAFLAGLRSAEFSSKKKYGASFTKISNAEKLNIVQQIGIITMTDGDEPFNFLETVKQLTVTGYMTSEYVMTNILKYEMVPSRFNGSFPVEKK